jgi:hypothetical protein
MFYRMYVLAAASYYTGTAQQAEAAAQRFSHSPPEQCGQAATYYTAGKGAGWVGRLFLYREASALRSPFLKIFNFSEVPLDRRKGTGHGIRGARF